MKTRVLVCAAIVVARVAVAQSLDQRVAAAPRGSVAFEYRTGPNVCGTSTSITVSDDASPGWTTRSHRSGINFGTRLGGNDHRCEMGPARVLLRRDGDRVSDVRVTVAWRGDRADAELGPVSADEAARYLLAIAPRLEGRAAGDAVAAAAIADGAVIWRRLLEIARDNGASESARKASVLWASQEATAAATAGLAAIAADDDAMESVRGDALMHLAQRPGGEGIPALVRVVRESKSIKMRKDAIWYLAQSRDPRAIDLFEKLLSGGR